MCQKNDLTTPDKILYKALEKEMQARDFYAELAATCTVDFVRNLLRKLQEEESKHVCMIEAMLQKLRSGGGLM